MPKPLLTIGLITFNSANTIIPCIASIVRYCTSGEAEIIVVDNNSDDATVELLQDNFLIDKLIVNPTNHGFAAAANKLIAAKEGKHLLLLNPDCELQSPIISTISSVFSEGPNVGLIGGDIHGEYGRPRESYGAFPSPAMVYWDFSGLRKIFPRRGWSTSIPFSGSIPHEVDYPTGAFLCIRDEALQRAIKFDTRFFAYFEDADYAMRLRAEGYRAIIHPSLKLRHIGGGSFRTAKKRYDEDFQLTCYFDSLFHFLEKHYGKRESNKARAFIERSASFKAFMGGKSAFGKRHRQVGRILGRLLNSDVRKIYRV